MLKKIGLFLSALLLSLFSLNAQDYQTVRSGRIAYFNNTTGFVKCIRIDSVAFQTDSVLYPMANIEQTDNNCFNPRGNSWIGKRVIIQNDGTNLFFNKDNDTIRIKTHAKINESWTAIELNGYMKVIAEIKSVDNLTILGELDSVKTIGFQVYDSNGNAKSHYLNEHSLIISKNYGFVRMMNFNLFPEEPTTPSFDILTTFSLIGLTNPARGMQNLNYREIFDFQVGDELHIQFKSWDWFNVPGRSFTRKTKLKYLERIESKDSIFYKIEREESIAKSIVKWDSTEYSYTHDTISKVYKPNIILDKLPGEPIITDFHTYSFVMVDDGQFIKKYRSAPLIPGNETDSCWHYLTFDDDSFGSYLKGLGGEYYEWTDIISGEENKLVYYKKGSTIWGTPLVITEVKSLEKEEQVKIYPNPVTDFVTIENPSGSTEEYELSIMDMQGREVWRYSIAFSNFYRLDLSLLKEGAYLLKLQNGEKQVSRMIVKKP